MHRAAALAPPRSLRTFSTNSPVSIVSPSHVGRYGQALLAGRPGNGLMGNVDAASCVRGRAVEGSLMEPLMPDAGRAEGSVRRIGPDGAGLIPIAPVGDDRGEHL